MTREEWLNRLAERMEGWYPGEAIPPVRLSVGFTSGGLRSKRIGECWARECDPEGACHIFIHPGITDAIEVAAILAHELVHAVVGHEAKHGPEFKSVAVALGLVGPMTATQPGDLFRERIATILDDIGPFPSGVLQPSNGPRSTPKKQTTRMHKAECPDCGYTIRLSRKWADVGVPMCPASSCTGGEPAVRLVMV
jgi:hypothetical protein